MEQWKKLIHINRNFQKAVNLQLDIGNHGRIENLKQIMYRVETFIHSL